MKKWLKILIGLLIVGAIVGFIIYVFSEVTPYDDTKKLYVSCNSNHKSYNVLSSDKIKVAEKDDKCKLSFEVRNVDRNFVKLRTDNYLYTSKTTGIIDIDNSPVNDIYVEPDRDLILYSLDKNTKFIFEYK